MEITQLLLKKYFSYANGNLFWIKKSAYCVILNSPAGRISGNDRYYRVSFLKKKYLLHRLIFLFNHGFLPKMIDHIDNDRNNNRIENLREVNYSQNGYNRAKNTTKKTKYKGVYKHIDKWVSSITVNKKVIFLGVFEYEEDAAKEYNKAAIKFHKEFAKTNLL